MALTFDESAECRRGMRNNAASGRKARSRRSTLVKHRARPAMERFSAILLMTLLWLSPSGPARGERPVASPQPLKGMHKTPGFVDIHRDDAGGRVFIGVHALDQPFLLVSALAGGLGSNDVGLDRNQIGEPRLVQFQQAGGKLLLVQNNTRFTADSPVAEERRAAVDAFAESVLWSAPLIDAGPRAEGPWIVDVSPLLLSDRHGVLAALRNAQQGEHKLDAERSVVLAERARSFPDNSEFESLLTFTGPGSGAFVKDVAMDAEAFSLRQRLSFVRLPEPGYVPRAYHPASGAWSVDTIDFAQPLDASLTRQWQARFRLEKTDPSAARSRVKKPIVFYLDPGTPEPMRSALIEGGNWWNQAFEAAGFIDAFRVEPMPSDADPLDIRYSTISWTPRATRGWSYGYGVADPRTGEIIKGHVILDSLRVRQDLLIAESLLAPFGKPDEAARRAQARAMALARVRQLSAHEIGHALGFLHNFTASRHGPMGSVLDYPHPVLALTAEGGIALPQPYGDGIGEWDKYLVAHGYGVFADEAQALARLRHDIFAKGYGYIEDAQSRAPGESHSDGLLWDYGPDSLATFKSVLEARRRALANFDRGVLPPDRQAGEIEARLVPVYLLHRYQSEAVARLLGGETWMPSLAGEGKFGTRPTPAAQQLAALDALIDTLQVDQLALPANVLALMTPPNVGARRTREYFAVRTGPSFDPGAAVEAATALQAQFLFDPARLNRLEWQHARDAEVPMPAAIIRKVLLRTWHQPPAVGTSQAAVAWSRNWVLLDALMTLATNEVLQPAVAAQVRGQIAQLGDFAQGRSGDQQYTEAARRIAAWLDDPARVKLRPLPPIPPGAPI